MKIQNLENAAQKFNSASFDQIRSAYELELTKAFGLASGMLRYSHDRAEARQFVKSALTERANDILELDNDSVTANRIKQIAATIY